MAAGVAIRCGVVGLGLLLAMGCTPKGTATATPGKPTPFPSARFGPAPAAELASLPVQPRSGTWEIVSKNPADKIKPFKVVLEFQPNGLIRVNGRLKTDEEAARDPYNRDFVTRSTSYGQDRTTVIFQLGGQYTLTLTGTESMDGVGMVQGTTPAGVRLKWLSDATSLVTEPA